MKKLLVVLLVFTLAGCNQLFKKQTIEDILEDNNLSIEVYNEAIDNLLSNENYKTTQEVVYDFLIDEDYYTQRIKFNGLITQEYFEKDGEYSIYTNEDIDYDIKTTPSDELDVSLEFNTESYFFKFEDSDVFYTSSSIFDNEQIKPIFEEYNEMLPIDLLGEWYKFSLSDDLGDIAEIETIKASFIEFFELTEQDYQDFLDTKAKVEEKFSYLSDINYYLGADNESDVTFSLVKVEEKQYIKAEVVFNRDFYQKIIEQVVTDVYNLVQEEENIDVADVFGEEYNSVDEIFADPSYQEFLSHLDYFEIPVSLLIDHKEKSVVNFHFDIDDVFNSLLDQLVLDGMIESDERDYITINDSYIDLNIERGVLSGMHSEPTEDVIDLNELANKAIKFSMVTAGAYITEESEEYVMNICTDNECRLDEIDLYDAEMLDSVFDFENSFVELEDSEIKLTLYYLDGKEVFTRPIGMSDLGDIFNDNPLLENITTQQFEAMIALVNNDNYDSMKLLPLIEVLILEVY